MNATESDPATQRFLAFCDGWAQVPDGWAQIIDDWAQARSGPPLATPLFVMVI